MVLPSDLGAKNLPRSEQPFRLHELLFIIRPLALLASLASFPMCRLLFLLKILAIINVLVSGSRSGTEVAVPLVLEQTWGQRLHEREDIDANRRREYWTRGGPFEGIR